MEKTLVVYHEDNDGICSAAIVKKYYKIFQIPDDKLEFYPMDYHKIEKFFNWFEIHKDEFKFVIIVDFSFGENWKRLLDMVNINKIIWIDHHKNAIENDYGTDILKSDGLRSSANAGCVLTWKYFFVNEIPKVVKLVEDYDIWKFEFGEDTWAFLYGSQGLGRKISNPASDYWDVLLEEEKNYAFRNSGYPELLRSIIRDGVKIHEYVKNINEEKCRAKAYISYLGIGITRDYGVKCVVINGGRGSAIFDSVTEDYEMMVVYWFDGQYYNYSFYSKKESGLDVSEIARAYGGNGHPNAADCRSEKMLFPKHAEVKW